MLKGFIHVIFMLKSLLCINIKGVAFEKVERGLDLMKLQLPYNLLLPLLYLFFHQVALLPHCNRLLHHYFKVLPLLQ